MPIGRRSFLSMLWLAPLAADALIAQSTGAEIVSEFAVAAPGDKPNCVFAVRRDECGRLSVGLSEYFADLQKRINGVEAVLTDKAITVI